MGHVHCSINYYFQMIMHNIYKLKTTNNTVLIKHFYLYNMAGDEHEYFAFRHKSHSY